MQRCGSTGAKEEERAHGDEGSTSGESHIALLGIQSRIVGGKQVVAAVGTIENRELPIGGITL
jgi:hypothetical protein